MYCFFKASAIDRLINESKARFNELITISISKNKFRRKCFDIRLCKYNNDNVFDVLENKLIKFVINKNKFVNLINKNNNFLIDEKSQLKITSAKSFVLLRFNKLSKLKLYELSESLLQTTRNNKKNKLN